MYSVVMMLALTTSPDAAGCCWGCGWGYGYGWGWGAYYAPAYYYPPAYYYSPVYYSGYPVATRAEPKQEPTEDGNDQVNDGSENSRSRSGTGTVVVSLPADARLLVNGKPLGTSSSRRTFVTPPLEDHTRYTYTMTAEVVRAGKTQTLTHTVVVKSGHLTNVKFDFSAADVAKR